MKRIKKKKIEEDNTFSMFEVVIIILISILFGIVIGYIITYNKNPMYDNKSGNNVSEIVNVYNNLVNNYYGKVDQDKLSDAAIKGMIESLDDPFTNYMDLTTTNEFNETVDGSFVGIGIVINYEEEGFKITEIMKNSPAEDSGLKVGDILTKIDDQELNVDYNNIFAKLIKGKVGTEVKVTVLRGDKEKSYVIKRSVIEIDTVHKHIFKDDNSKIGYVKIDSFASNSSKQFDKAIKRFDKEKINSLIIDVRDNPGGHLKEVRNILSNFFDKKTVLYQIKTNNQKKKISSINNDTKDYNIVVLINSGSASASEILASCFKENYSKVTIVGVDSYGKGTVQKSQTLNSGSAIKYTTEKWLTSKGKWLDKKGVKPDVYIEEDESYRDNPTYDNDIQLKMAINKLKESN